MPGLGASSKGSGDLSRASFGRTIDEKSLGVVSNGNKRARADCAFHEEEAKRPSRTISGKERGTESNWDDDLPSSCVSRRESRCTAIAIPFRLFLRSPPRVAIDFIGAPSDRQFSSQRCRGKRARARARVRRNVYSRARLQSAITTR